MEFAAGASAGSWDEVQDELEAAGLSDGLPLVPPTPERVAAMLAPHGVDPDEAVATLAPAFGQATWRSLAINAVMAGCRPAYLPVIAAAVEAMAAPEFNLLGIQTTTGSAATAVIVSGPVAQAIGMNAGCNALGPGNRANATIGRAVRLALQNIGGAKPGETDMATLGQPAKYGFCFAENHADSPWPPLHATRGFETGDSVVTAVGTGGIVEVLDSSSERAEDALTTYVQSMLIAGTVGGGGTFGGGEPLVIVPPEHAQLFESQGYSRARVQAALFERAQLPLDRLSPGVAALMRKRREIAGSADASAPVRIAARAEDVMIVVAGGVGIKAAYVPTWSGSTRAVSRRVRASR